MLEIVKKNIALIIGVVIFIIIGNEVYTQINQKPKSAKSFRLTCHKEGVTFEKVIKKDLVKSLQQHLKSDDYKLIVWADKSVYMKTVMFNFVDIETIQKDIKEKFIAYPTNLDTTNKEKKEVLVDIMVYENDKKDPGKKTTKSKLYAGYLTATFKVNKHKVYKIQTDFMSLKGEDIPQRVSCIVKSVMTLGEQNGKK